MKGRIRWIEGRQMIAESGSGHAFVLDAPASFNGRNTGPTPMELMLLGTAGCTAVDVVFILNDRMKQKVTGLTVSAEADRADTEPKVFTAVHLDYDVEGEEVSEKKLLRAITLSQTKYCSASAMIEHTATVSAHWRYRDRLSGETREGVIDAPATGAGDGD